MGSKKGSRKTERGQGPARSEARRGADGGDRSRSSGAGGDEGRSKVFEVMDNTRDRLQALRGQVFHVIAGDNRLVRFRIGTDGELALDRQFESLNLQNLVTMPRRMMAKGRENLMEAREMVLEAGKEARGRARRKWRKVVTGDPEKRIRDHMREVPQVKMIDKLSFTFGVLTICGLEWLALRHASWFPPAYYCMMTILLAMRYFLYKADKYQLFMLDYCYFMNISVMCQTALFPDNFLWFKANYVMTMGPLMFAIIVWKNSLVFHSLDKLTSFYLHAMPPLTLHLFRYVLKSEDLAKSGQDTISLYEVIVAPLGLYLTWQLGYLAVTEALLRTRLAEDKDLITSLRYLACDKKNGFRNLIIQILERMGIKGKDEEFNPDQLKTKLVFISSQLIYTFITIIPTPFLYQSYAASCCYFVVILGWGTWNGASYYIEVFSERYKLQFVKVGDAQESKGNRATTADPAAAQLLEPEEGREVRDVSAGTEDSDDSDSDMFENALDSLDELEQSEFYQSILALMNEEMSATADPEDDNQPTPVTEDQGDSSSLPRQANGSASPSELPNKSTTSPSLVDRPTNGRQDAPGSEDVITNGANGRDVLLENFSQHVVDQIMSEVNRGQADNNVGQAEVAPANGKSSKGSCNN